MGMYPTQLGTTNALAGRTAPFHIPLGGADYSLGGSPTYEANAIEAITCDWITGPPCDFDDGVTDLFFPSLQAGIAAVVIGPPCGQQINAIFPMQCPVPPPGAVVPAVWRFNVNRGASSTQAGFVNVVADFAADRRYGGGGAGAAEWVLVNAPLPAGPGPHLFVTGPFPVQIICNPNNTWTVAPFWTRAMVSPENIALPAGVGWDGSGRIGGYNGGETEDWVPLGDPGSPTPTPAPARTDSEPVVEKQSLATEGPEGTTPCADFGDAPDNDPACPSLMMGMYPTQLGTTNALAGRTAPFHFPLGGADYSLGGSPTYEANAIEAITCDWITGPPCDFDDGVTDLFFPSLQAGIAAVVVGPPCGQQINAIFPMQCPVPPPGAVVPAVWRFNVNRGASSTQAGFVNVVADFAADRRYGGGGAGAAEWVLVNAPLPAGPGPHLFVTGPFPVQIICNPNNTWTVAPFWTRAMVSPENIALPAGVGWDGSGRIGGYNGGETEDWVPLGDPGGTPTPTPTPTPPNQTTICHRRTQTLVLASNSLELQRHLDHGDTVGQCGN